VDQILLYYSRSQAPAWERNVLEALPLAPSSVRQANKRRGCTWRLCLLLAEDDQRTAGGACGAVRSTAGAMERGVPWNEGTRD